MLWNNSTEDMMKSFFFYYVKVTYLNDKGIQSNLSLGDEL